MLRNVMVPWHVVMSKAEYGHNAGNEVAKGTALSKRTKSKTVMGIIALHSLKMASDHQRGKKKKNYCIPALVGQRWGKKLKV